MSDGRYRAFISYSHADDKWAAWLHRALEAYKPPRRLVGKKTRHGYVPARLGNVFRDREELPTATDLGEVINEALVNSACQVVVCSPAAARSKWVNEEIKAFKRLGREDRIFCLIIGGEPNATEMPGREDEECFPEALRYKLGANGELSDERTEPIAADARPNKDGKLNAKLKLISGMLGVGFDALAQREMHRRQRRIMAVAAGSMAGMLLTTTLAVLALFARAEADNQRIRAEREAETARLVTDFMVGLFEVSDPGEALGNSITAREILDRGSLEIESELGDQPEIQATLMRTMGSVYFSLGLYDRAVALLEEALVTRKALFGEDNVEVADVLASLAEALKEKDEYSESEQMYRDALRIRLAALGDEHAGVADLKRGLAALLGDIGDYANGESMYREALATHRETLGDANPDVARDLEGLAFNLFKQGKLQESEDLFREAIDLRHDLDDGPDPDLADALNNLGLVLDASGQYEEAEKLLREALAMQRLLHPDGHKDIAMVLNNIAYMLHDQGQFEAAEVAYRDALDIQREFLGDSHTDVAITLNNLAFLLYDNGDKDAAAEMLRQSLDMFRQVLGEEHPDVATVTANLGMWLTEAGNYDAAEPLLQSALDQRRALLGDEHPDVADSMTLLADLMILTGRFDEARELSADASRISAAALSDDHWRTATAISAEGAALAELGRFDEAEDLLGRSYEILNGDVGALPIVLSRTRNRLARLYELWGRPDVAAEYH